MGIKKKAVEPKADAKKIDERGSKDAKADRKVERKTQLKGWSDVGIKYAVTRLG